MFWVENWTHHPHFGQSFSLLIALTSLLIKIKRQVFEQVTKASLFNFFSFGIIMDIFHLFFYHLSVISHSAEIQHTETLQGHQISPSTSPMRAGERHRHICDDWVDFLATRSKWSFNNINQIEVIFIFCYTINNEQILRTDSVPEPATSSWWSSLPPPPWPPMYIRPNREPVKMLKWWRPKKKEYIDNFWLGTLLDATTNTLGHS